MTDPPVFTVVPPTTVNITYGQSQSLTCIAIGDDILLVWYHNGIMISNSNTINITNATLSHAGAYQCFAIGPTTHVTHSTLITIKSESTTCTCIGNYYCYYYSTCTFCSFSCYCQF